MGEGEPGEVVFTVRVVGGVPRIYRRAVSIFGHLLQHWLDEDVAERLVPLLPSDLARQLAGCLAQLNMQEAA